MHIDIDKDWFAKRSAAEGDLEIGAGLPDYVPPFIPSAADRHYGGIITKLMARIAELDHYRAHFTALAKVSPAANTALDTARREWAKREGR